MIEMCELSVYIVEGDKESLFAEDIINLIQLDGKVEMRDLLGTIYVAEGVLKEVDITRERATISR